MNHIDLIMMMEVRKTFDNWRKEDKISLSSALSTATLPLFDHNVKPASTNDRRVWAKSDQSESTTRNSRVTLLRSESRLTFHPHLPLHQPGWSRQGPSILKVGLWLVNIGSRDLISASDWSIWFEWLALIGWIAGPDNGNYDWRM